MCARSRSLAPNVAAPLATNAPIRKRDEQPVQRVRASFARGVEQIVAPGRTHPKRAFVRVGGAQSRSRCDARVEIRFVRRADATLANRVREN